jgi:Uma2 family endonuclease
MSSPSPSSLKLTYEDYALFPEDGRRHELVDGEHCVSPAPTLRHQTIVANLLFALRLYLRSRPAGQVFTAPADVVLSVNDTVQPDLLFISNARAAILGDKNVQGAPDLVVEIVSDTTRRMDEITKRKLYERFGVTEYWVVDPALETVKIYRRGGDLFQVPAELTLESRPTLTTPLLPGLGIPLAEIFDN